MSDAPTCDTKGCGKPAPNSSICVACRADLLTTIRAIPALWDELVTRMIGERGIDYRTTGGSRGSEVPMPLHEKASDLRDQILASLIDAAIGLTEGDTRIARLLQHELRPGTICRLLERRIDDIARADWAASFANALHRNRAAMIRMIDTPPGNVYAGPCNGIGRISADGTPDTSADVSADDYLEPCGNDMGINEDDRHHTATVRCRTCGSTYSLAARQDWVRQQYLGRLVTVSDGAILLGIPKDTIKSWIRRKRILSKPSADAQQVYLVDELVELDRGRKVGDAA